MTNEQASGCMPFRVMKNEYRHAQQQDGYLAIPAGLTVTFSPS